MSDFLSGLGDVLNHQFSLGENKMQSLDVIKNGHTVPYGRLGDFANKFDQSAERQYVEEGWQRTDLFNPKVKQMEIWMQEPDVTILVKKRAFSSLVENYRPDLMSNDEKLFIRATKFLFQNKCKQIAAYERLTKIQSVATEIGAVDYHLMPAIFAATDTLGALFGPDSSSFNKFRNVIDRVRTIVNLSNDNIYTTWTTNVLNSFRTDLGEGTGVIEFTTAFNIDTTTSTNFGGGSFRLSFVDPYEIMRITHNDIEQAIADATNTITGNSFVQLSLNTLNDGIQSDKETLNKIRLRRGANPINFIVNPDTFLGKRVRAIIDISGIEIKFEGSILNVNIDPAYLTSDNIPTNREIFDVISSNLDNDVTGNERSLFGVGFIAGKDGLKKDEEKIFKRIITSLFNAMQINKNSRSVARSHNAKTNALRKKLRLHYGTNLIIQPMDIVHIFVSSKTKVDNKVLGGLQDSFNSVSFLQTANKALMNLQDFFNAGQDNSIEKSLFVGKDFPNWLWLTMRNQFVTDKSGTQIFAGLVDSSTSSYDSNGTFTVSVQGKDNAAYFSFGVINFKPSQEVWNGSLYDPITPFDIKFDRATGFQKDTVPLLLQENQDLFKSAFVKYKNGLYVGKKPNLDNFVQDTERVQNTSTRRVFYDPDGMVYKWKEGIGALVMFGNNYEETPTSNTATAPVLADPFAGQDTMNLLSLLITGEPYNFSTFYKIVTQSDTYGRDVQTGEDPSASYFRNLQTDIKKRNLLYGNFVPFKKLSMDSNTYKNIVNNQIRAQGFDRELNELLSQRADLNDRISSMSNFRNSLDVSPEAQNLQFKIDNELNPKIDAKIQQINKELNKIDKPISIIGDDISLDYNPDNDLTDKNNLHNIENLNRDLRRKTHYLTRRLSWKVRANEDMNFFIVDDSYDKDYDIQAFEQSVDTNAFSVYRNDYTSVSEKIEDVRKNLDLEVFANSQGHIEVRPPQYNKIPSSVFYRMLRLKQEFDIQLYPQFLEDLYVNQIDNILSRLEILEDEIRMYGLALAIGNDKELENFLSTQTTNIKANNNITPFKFISDEGTGLTSRIILHDLTQTNDPDAAASVFSNGLNALGSIKTQATINNILSVSTRANLLQQTSDVFRIRNADLNAILSNKSTNTRRDQITARLEQKTQRKFDLKQLFPNSDKLLGKLAISELDLFKILDDIAQRLTERQKILKVASTALKNAEEGLSVIKNEGQIANKLLAPGLLNNKILPAGLDNLIEDETYDDYGPGSGHRYVIKNAHIKRMSITESSPKYTAVEVHGKFNFISNQQQQDLNGFQGAGNAQTSATAVDYDLWRMYGVRTVQSIPAPFLTDPETQCAPFAVAVLNKARKLIKSGSIDIFGNEYMQPGEVVYIESQDMLFYVESVNHRITYGRDFSTSLQVGYGHMPGEYIPTYLDTVGKILYKNKDITNYVSVRQNNVNNEEHIGTIVGNVSGGIVNSQGLAQNDIMQGIFATENQQVLRSLLQSAESAFIVANANYKPILELRTFYASQSGFSAPSPIAHELSTTVKKFLVGDNNMFESLKVEQPKKFLKDNADSIRPVAVNSDNPEEFRSPSSHTYSMARAALNKSSGNSSNTVDDVIYNYVVDCWIHYKEV